LPIVTSLLESWGAQAASASALLNEAWPAPALHYTREYLEWQAGFPAPWPLPAAAAFDGAVLAGFAAATARRVRHGPAAVHVAVVSFVAVKPDYRNRGVAATLYNALLEALKLLKTPILTFAVPGSAGERTLLKAYPRAGFSIQPFGSYAGAMAIQAGAPPASDWRASFAQDASMVPSLLDQVIEHCAREQSILWSAPDDAQMAHYRTDPRARKVILLEHRERGPLGAGFLVESTTKTPQGIQAVPTLESILLRKEDAGALPLLLHTATAAAGGARNTVISVPNLLALENVPASGGAKIRRVGAGFHGYLCSREPRFDRTRGTSLEIV
jgi:GNAT superfamily N-acetyltransferase